MNYKQTILYLLQDIRFWILLFFLLRMYGITNPPLEVGHNWRQTDGLMIARNFYERDANIFYPTVDLAGEKSGIVGCEFPILNYLIYLVSLVFGYEHWYGRIIVLIFSSLGIFYFYKIIRKYFGEFSAFNATIIILVSLWFSYSRKNIPDAFAVSLCIISLYFALRYFENNKLWDLLFYFVLGLLGCLAKVSAASILTVLLIPVLSSKNSLKSKLLLSFFSSLILLSVYGWYFVWVPKLNATYGFGDHFFMGVSFLDGAKELFQNWPIVLKRFYDTPLKYTGFAAFLTALFLVIRKKEWLPLTLFLLPFLSFLMVLVKTGGAIVGDTYYVLTMIPPMAFITGYGLTLLNSRRIVSIVLIIVGVEGLAAQIYDFRIRQPFRSLENLESIMDEISQPNDLIAVNSSYFHNPTAMYFTHRRGWVATNQYLTDTTYLNDIRNKGCKYVLVAKKLYGDITLEFPKVHDSEYFKVYKVK